MRTIFRIVLNSFYIVEGYTVWAWDEITGSASKRAVSRLAVCGECEHSKRGVCELCGCILKAKARVRFPMDSEGKSVDGCPERRW